MHFTMGYSRPQSSKRFFKVLFQVIGRKKMENSIESGIIEDEQYKNLFVELSEYERASGQSAADCVRPCSEGRTFLYEGLCGG